MTGGRVITVYGTVMATRQGGREYAHHVEATGPQGRRLDLTVIARRRHTGSVRVLWDPRGEAEPRFPAEVQWRLIGMAIGIVVVIVVGGWLIFG